MSRLFLNHVITTPMESTSMKISQTTVETIAIAALSAFFAFTCHFSSLQIALSVLAGSVLVWIFECQSKGKYGPGYIAGALLIIALSLICSHSPAEAAATTFAHSVSAGYLSWMTVTFLTGRLRVVNLTDTVRNAKKGQAEKNSGGTDE